MPPRLRLVSLNVERSKHLERILPFLDQHKPDVVCLMELMEKDIPSFKAVAGEYVAYEPMLTKHGSEGIGIFSRLPLRDVATHLYGERYFLLTAHVDAGGADFKIGATHFPVTPVGAPDDTQRACLSRLLAVLQTQGEIVFCGDFNAPRGGEIAAEIIRRYKDNIPASYTMSLDVALHRVGEAKLLSDARALGLEGLMVDYIFSTPGYMVSNVVMESGVSDHKALVATVSKN
jgi:endonuclease/exonuclease/phosphatase family metal-dependent hydrolase